MAEDPSPFGNADSPTVEPGGPQAGAVRPGGMGEGPGDRIGPFLLLEQIGEGGFGVVWLAERRDPMVQRVALKIIKPGMDSKAVVARFEQERQVLAVMDHPNVAKVLDGGVTAAGRPYFVMELVRGEPITRYADRNRLTIRERLELFLPVCEAVQHAHMKGVIHRDLKPSNILVAPVAGGEGTSSSVVKVIDFGVAKAINLSLAGGTIFTERGQLVGTPEYMSPEQANLGAEDIDTRTDVYSLGVVLYELLSGTLPFEGNLLRRAGYAEIQRIIREVEPPRPSTRLDSVDEGTGTSIARARRTDRSRISVELRRELDWIPMKALRKDRTRRYASAESMAADVRRYLAGRPLEAAPEGRLYLLRKFVRRNRVQVTAAAAVAVALLAGSGAALWQARVASRERDAARNAEAAERERADELKAVADFQSEMLRRIDVTEAGLALVRDLEDRLDAALAAAGGPEAGRVATAATMRELLAEVNATDVARSLIDRTILQPAIREIEGRFADKPVVDAALRQALADLYRDLGLLDAAYPLQEAALATRRRSLGEDDPDTITSINNRGGLLDEMGRYPEAEASYREALERRRRVRGEDHEETLVTLNNLAAVLRSQSRLDEARAIFHEVLEKRRRLLGEDDPDTVVSMNNLAAILQSMGDLEGPEPYLREALERRRRLLGDDDPDTLLSLHNLGFQLGLQGKLDEAEPMLREALERSRRVRGDDHPMTIRFLDSVGALLRERGDPEGSEPLAREALQRSRRVHGSGHPTTLACLHSVGMVLAMQGRHAEAEAAWREVLDRSGPDGDGLLTRLQALGNLGYLLQMTGRLEEAARFFASALEACRRQLSDDHPQTRSSLGNLAYVLTELGRLDDAEPLHRENLELLRRRPGPDDPATLLAMNNLSDFLRLRGRFEEAESLLRTAIDASRRVHGGDHPRTLIYLGNLAGLLEELDRPAEAEPFRREAVEGSRDRLGEMHPDTIDAVAGLGLLLERLGRHSDALELLAPLEPAARAAFRHEDPPRLATLLAALGRVRTAMGFDPGRFTLAEANLLEARAIIVESRGPDHESIRASVEALIRLYDAWHAAEPGTGRDAKAAGLRAELEPGVEPDAERPEPGR